MSDNGPWPPPGVHLVTDPGIVPPQIVTQVQPRPTAATLRARPQGAVILACVIETDGTVGEVHALQSLDQANGVDDSAIAAVKEWRFVPAKLKNVPVAVVINVSMNFNLGARGAVPANTPVPEFSWPLAFPQKNDAASATLWTEDVEEGAGLQFRIAHPDDWRVISKNTATGVVSLGSRDGRAAFNIMVPRPIDRELAPMLKPALDAFASTMKTAVSKRPNAQVSAVGQIRASGQLWAWVEVPLTIDEATLPADMPPLAAGLFDGAVMWDFASTSAGRLVQIAFIALRERNESDADFQKDMHDAGVVFSQILQRIVIQPR
jgi:TonB family protein